MFFSYGSIWKYFRVFKDAHTHTERESDESVYESEIRCCVFVLRAILHH